MSLLMKYLLTMRYPLRKLAVLLVSFLSSLHAQEMNLESSPLPHSLRIRQPQLATCTYTASHVVEPNVNWYRYTYSIDLPGAFWRALCADPKIIKFILGGLELRCSETWLQTGLEKVFEQHSTLIHADRCHIRLRIRSKRTQDITFPEFKDDCILKPKPELCGLANSYFPWPTECVRMEVGL